MPVHVPHTGPDVVEANGIRIAYETFGDPGSEPLLLIMGLGMQMVAWDDDLCAQLAERGFYVIRFDNRDMGLSTRFDEAGVPSLFQVLAARLARKPLQAPYRLHDMAEDSVGLLDALGIGSAHVVGMSLGGMIAQLMAIHHPERVRTLTCIMSRASGDRSAGRPTLRALALLLTSSPPEREPYLQRAVRVWEVLGGSGYPFDPERVRRRAVRAYDRGLSPTGTRRQLAAEMASGSRVEALRSVKIPTLVIHGDEDPLLPVQGGKQIAECVPGAELMIIEGMGHTLPESVWPWILDAIARHAGGDREHDTAGQSDRG